MEDQIKKLVEQLFTTEDLREAQRLAVELQRAVYGHIEQLQKRVAEVRFVQSEEKPCLEVGIGSTGLDGLHSEPMGKDSLAKTPIDI